MFDRFLHIAAKYPLYIAGGVLATVILIWFLSRGSGNSNQVSGGIVAYGPSDTVVVANAQIEQARINANAGTAQAQYAKELQTSLANIYADMNIDNNKTTIGIKSLDSGVAIHAIDASKYITDSNNAAAVQMTTTTVAGDVAMNKQDNDASVTAAQASADAAIQAAAYHASEVAAQLNTQYAQAQMDAAFHASEVAAQIQSDQFLKQNGY